MQLHNRKIVHKSWNSWIDDHLSRRGRKVNFVMKFYTLFPKPFCGKGDQKQYDIFFNIFSKIRFALELVSKELNHLAAILHVYAEGLIL
jgi:hypothetical protein